MRSIKKIITAVVSFVAIAGLAQSGEISVSEAGKHIGHPATVCGKVESAYYAKRSNGQPTLINLDKAYPHPIFTIVIWGKDRSRFTTPETAYLHKRICVTGVITENGGTPEIFAHAPSDIKLAEHR